MKRKLLWAVKLLCVIAAVVICIGLLQEYVFCHADHNRQRIKGFYLEDEQSLDVVYLGASEVYSDIAPGYAYSRDRITGYLFATQANTILNYKSQLKNILSRQKDSLIVIELNGALYDEEDLTKESSLRNYSDHVPLDLTKAEWVAENGMDNPLEYLFPFIKYHNSWGDTEDHTTEETYRKTISNDRQRGYNYLKGVLNYTFVFPAVPSKNAELTELANEKAPLNEQAEKELRELLEYCRDENLTNVVFARFPHIVTDRNYDRFLRNNTVTDIVEEYGFDYLNFERDFAMTGLDEKKDFYNLEHLNVYGQKKFTAFLTDYLKEHYGLTSHVLSDKQREEWETCADYYEAYAKYNEDMIANNEHAELSENWELIEELQDYLPEEGSVRVNLTADGSTETISTAAATVRELLNERNITLGVDDTINVPIDTAVTDGMTITVSRVEYRSEDVEEEIPFIIRETPDDTLPEGETKLIREGVNGIMQVTYNIRYVDGVEESREKIAEKRLKGAVPKIVAVGTAESEG